MAELTLTTVNLGAPDPNDLAAAVEQAVGCGAELADFQPQDDVRVCLDPAGHPFCRWLG